MDFLHHNLNNYLQENSCKESEVSAQLTRETHLKIPMPQMLSGHLQGKVLELFVRLLKPKNVLEIGTFTGYATLYMAQGLLENAKIITLDVNEELETICTKYWDLAGVSEKIDFRKGRALDIIPTLNQTFDLVFIDADKTNYCNYFDAVIEQINVGGLIIADNVLWSGKVLIPTMDKDTKCLHDYNQKVNADPRVESFILPIRDGLNIARKL